MARRRFRRSGVEVANREVFTDARNNARRRLLKRLMLRKTGAAAYRARGRGNYCRPARTTDFTMRANGRRTLHLCVRLTDTAAE